MQRKAGNLWGNSIVSIVTSLQPNQSSGVAQSFSPMRITKPSQPRVLNYGVPAWCHDQLPTDVHRMLNHLHFRNIITKHSWDLKNSSCSCGFPIYQPPWRNTRVRMSLTLGSFQNSALCGCAVRCWTHGVCHCPDLDLSLRQGQPIPVKALELIASSAAGCPLLLGLCEGKEAIAMKI